MIYLDNAATTKYKPDEVFDAFNYYIREIGVSPGRGSYSLGIDASRMLYQARKTVANYFGLLEPNVIFTKNSTEAINLFFRGFLKKGDHVLISCYEHNAILRPLHEMKSEGIIDYSVISRGDLELSAQDIYDKYVMCNTVLFETTLASNLTGRIVSNSEILRFMKNKGISTFVDSSQGAGKIKISMKEDGIDYLAFTGHKDLLALPGVGGLVCVNKFFGKPLLQGGTGILGDLYVNPDVFPDAYEAGTLNMPAIWSLKVALDWLKNNKLKYIKDEKIITEYFLKELGHIKNVVIYDDKFQRVGVIGLNIKGVKSNEVVQYLDESGICTRGGIHCAILAHEALDTKETGVVRFSLGLNNNKSDIDKVLELLKKVGD